MATPSFPVISEDKRRAMLKNPSGPVRVAIDTDTRNEIDDQYALAWALLSQDVLKIEGVYAEPYTFQHRIDEIVQSLDIRENLNNATDAERELLNRYAGQIARYEEKGIDPRTIRLNTPGEGMEGSYQEILTVFQKMNEPADGLVFRGSDRYLTSLDEPVRSPAAEHLIERALAGSSDDPLYIVGIGCVTNIASALLMAPEICDRVVVTWTAGFPTFAPYPNHSFNLEQDVLSAQVLFDSGVPLVYLPGYYIGAQLGLSLPEMEAWVRGQGAIGDYLYHLYTHNPLYELFGIDDHFGRTWIIWDLINIAWLLNPDWVPSELVTAPELTDDRYWRRTKPDRHLIREAYEINRDAIFRDFFIKLQRAP